MSAGPRRSRLTHQQRVLLLAILAGLPGALVSIILLWSGDYSAKVRWTLATVILAWWWAVVFALRERVVRPLQTLSNLLAALREGDYGIRARGASGDDVLGLAVIEVNALGDTLRTQRFDAVEAEALLRRVIAEIDVAIFAFDREVRLRLVNREGERILALPSERLLGRRADELGLTPYLHEAAPRTLEAAFPGGHGRWEVRRTTFRQGGLEHQLLVISDLSRALREEERQAWQRLIRVLSHEINNSLAPIKSIAGSLESMLVRGSRPAADDEDLRQGLGIIAGRSQSLSRFIASYARLARLPTPKLRSVPVGAWVRRVAALEERMEVAVRAGEEVTIRADGDQLEQLLINLVRNAVDAAIETGGGVRVGWRVIETRLEVWVEDDGPGIPDTANLFVPFYTTKPAGSGIGLALSRQIAEAHGGTLTVANRARAPGAEARLVLPLRAV